MEGWRALAHAGVLIALPLLGTALACGADDRDDSADRRAQLAMERSVRELVTKGGDDYTVRDVRTGRPVGCPPLRAIRTKPDDAIDGGCVMRVSSPAAPLVLRRGRRVREVARCRAAYTLHFDDRTQVLTDHARFGGEGVCRRIVRCDHGETGLTWPWQGQKLADPHGGVAIRMDICVRTPLGRIRGLQVTRLYRAGRDLRARPYDLRVGGSDVRFLGDWDVEPDRLKVGPPADP